MRTLLSVIVLFAIGSSAAAQEGKIDLSKIPSWAAAPAQFAPEGWKVEGVAEGDLNRDGRSDVAIKLIEDRGPEEKETPPPGRNRILAVALEEGGRLKRVAVSDRLLQCTSCGGAFYGMLEASAHVDIIKGVILVEQEHGSREVSNSKLRFRFEPSSRRFLLIGYDYNCYDRGNGRITYESTNYVTGLRITKRGREGRLTTQRQHVKLFKIYLDEIDADAIESEAVQRLGLG